MKIPKNSPFRATLTWAVAVSALVSFYDIEIVKIAAGLVAFFVATTFPLVLLHYGISYIKAKRQSAND